MTRPSRRSILLHAVCLLLLIFPTLLPAQDLIIRFEDDNGLIGFKDWYGKIAIPAKYDDAYSFTEGLGLVKINSKWGYIDKNGNFVIPAKYDDGGSFSEGLGVVKINGKWGYIDKKGNYVIPVKYDDAYSFTEGLAKVKINGKWGFIDKTGKLVIPASYEDAGKFSEGKAPVINNGKYGFIDKNGSPVLPAKFEDFYHFSEGLAPVEMNGRWGFIDKTADLVIPTKYDGVLDFSEGLAKVEINGKYGYIDEKDKLVIPAIYDDANYFSEGLAPVELDGKWGFIDKNNRFVIPAIYDDARYFTDGLAPVQTNGKCGFVDKNGNLVIPAIYDDANLFSEGLALVIINRKYGFIDKNNRLVIPAKYYSAESFSEGLAPVLTNDKWGFIDKNDNFIIPAKYDWAEAFSEGLAGVQIRGKWGFIDKNGDLVIAPKYDEIFPFYQGLAWVDSMNLGKVYIDREGNEYQTKEEALAAIKNRPGSNVSTTPQPSVAEDDVDKNIPQGTRKAENTLAVIIANTNYKHASKVDNAGNDGEVLEKYLIQTLGLPRENVLKYVDATYGDFKTAMNDIKLIANAYAYAGQEFDVIFYYVGHGLPDNESRESYLLPIDINPRTINVCYPLSTLYQELADLKAANVTVMIDACFCGSNYGGGMLDSASMGAVIKAPRAEPKGNMVVFTAADGHETAFPYKEKGHGLFTYYILKKLQESRGNVTLGELKEYVTKNVVLTSAKVNRTPQTPTVVVSPTIQSSWRNLRLGR